MDSINTLQALLNDVKGNEFLGDAKKMSGYLKSISLLSDAMARHSWQQFELDVLDELKELKSGPEINLGLDAKVKLATRELELADLQIKVMNFHTCVASDVFMSKEDAARSLRKIAEHIEAKHSALFPKPWTEEDARAYAKKIGANYIESDDTFEDFLDRMKSKAAKTVSEQPKAKKTKSRT